MEGGRLTVDYEGLMYRMVASKGLRSYYYYLIGRELYIYRKKEDPMYKTMIHLSQEDCVVGAITS